MHLQRIHSSPNCIQKTSMRVVRLRASTRRVLTPGGLPVRFWFHAVWSRPVASHRSLGCRGCPSASGWLRTRMSVRPLVYQQPQQCFCALATQPRAWLDGLTDWARGPPNRFPQVPLASVAMLDGHWFGPGSGLPDSAMRLCSTCAPLTSGVPHGITLQFSLLASAENQFRLDSHPAQAL